MPGLRKVGEMLNDGFAMLRAMRSPTARAEVLIEALPFIQKFRGSLFVVKYGGSAMDDAHIVERFLRDIVFLEAVGINPVLIHGGGKAITEKMREAGLKPRFVNGLRVTDAASIRIVEEVLDEDINPAIVLLLKSFGARATGIFGKEVLVGRKLPPQSDQKAADVDLGFVGEVTEVNLAPIQEAIAQDVVPVISPLARDADGSVLNINADVVAGTLAGQLKAAKFIYLSDVAGIMRDPTNKESLIPSVTRAEIGQLREEGVISGGMIPKVESAMHALEHGVGKVHFINGRTPHSLLLEIFTSDGVG